MTYQQQLQYIFDRPVTKPDWYWADDENPLTVFDLDPLSGFEFIEKLPANIKEDLRPFSDDQIAIGLDYIFSGTGSGAAADFQEAKVLVPRRIQAIGSLFHLFRDIYAARCQSQVSKGKQEQLTRLNTNCYMFWDVTPLSTWSDDPMEHDEMMELSAALLKARDWEKMGLPPEEIAKMKQLFPEDDAPPKASASKIAERVLKKIRFTGKSSEDYYRAIAGVMEKCLQLDHPACVESALHGLGHMVFTHPDIAKPIIMDYLKNKQDAHPRLLEYARAASTGMIL